MGFRSLRLHSIPVYDLGCAVPKYRSGKMSVKTSTICMKTSAFAPAERTGVAEPSLIFTDTLLARDAGRNVVGSVVHCILVEGTMETMSKAALRALVLVATLKVISDLGLAADRCLVEIDPST